jgi:hypothetical protein
MAMSKRERKEILKAQAIDDEDIFRFRWRIAQILCEAPTSWGGLTDVELIIRAHLHGYRNLQLERDFLKGKHPNFYKALIDDVMTDLVKRGVAYREDETIPFGDIEMYKYKRGRSLTKVRCDKIIGTGLGDKKIYSQLFPV